MKKSDDLPTDIGLLVLRLALAAVFVFHGSQKLFGLFGGYGIEGTAGWMESIGIPFATVSAVLAGSAEFFGGLALLTGFAQRLLAVPLTITMFVAAFTAHHGFDASQGGMEYPLTLAFAVAAMGATGPGRFAVRLGRSSEA
ncbi:MAG: DoxX family protein [Planctomycetota bacterium]